MSKRRNTVVDVDDKITSMMQKYNPDGLRKFLKGDGTLCGAVVQEIERLYRTVKS